MKIEDFVQVLKSDYYVGVPDSQLKALCDYLMEIYGIDSNHHVIAANEGNCTAIAAGYHLATGKIPVVYMQNSGEGNIINPVASLLNENVYAIPMIFVIGWRGEPGVYDEPQHFFQGKVTLRLLEDMNIKAVVVDSQMSIEQLEYEMKSLRKELELGHSVAVVIKKNSLEYKSVVKYSNEYSLTREEIIHAVIEVTNEDPIICTTGKASRELFEARVEKGQSHQMDFLTVGSMGHTSSIALGVALQQPEKKIWCIDGDGAVLMHMGAMAVIGNVCPENLVHIVINNGAHESVGGMPTVAENIDFQVIAKACGYTYVRSIKSKEILIEELQKAKKERGLRLLEIKCAIGARPDLGRPTTTARKNKEQFMNYLLENKNNLCNHILL